MSWTERTSPIQPGERVAYSRTFLQSIGALTGDMPFSRGVVEKIEEFGTLRLATVKWDGEETPMRVAAANLVPDRGKGIIDRY
jgi:hypothetical protein